MIDEIKDECVKSWCEEYSKAVRWMIEENGFPKEAAEFESVFEDAYVGTYANVEEYIDELVDDLFGVSVRDWPFNRIDFDGAWHDLQSDGYWSYREDSGDIHIFKTV